MSMTREGARIEIQAMKDTFEEYEPGGSRCQAALEIALSALRPVSREQVEKVWRGEWVEEPYSTKSERNRIIHSKKCICSVCNKSNGRKKRKFLPILRRSHDGRGRADGDGEVGGVERWQYGRLTETN